jgi:predicted dehydrogenase
MKSIETSRTSALRRRSFLKGILATGTLSVITPRTLFAADGSAAPVVAASGKVNVACCGIGNGGGEDVMALAASGLANFVAFCDTDMGAPHTLAVLKKFPKVPRFQDFRQMFDKMGKDIEAACVGTPDFSHFPIAMLAMSLGKHVYSEKPMGHSFRQVELMMAAEKKYNVATQMGNQGHSEANYFQFKAWTEAGIIKNVTRITAFMNGSRRWHSMKVSGRLPAQPIPATLDWETWLATAQEHQYNVGYGNGDWRSWFDFGNGALGDWGAHIFDTAHEFLHLGLPTEVEAVKLDGWSPYIFPQASTLAFRFPARGSMPPLKLTWYDGQKNLPPLPADFGGSVVDPNIPPPLERFAGDENAGTRQSHLRRRPDVQRRLAWLHTQDHSRIESEGNGVVPAVCAKKHVRTSKKFSTRVQGRGKMPFAVRGRRAVVPDDGAWHHRPTRERQAGIRPRYETDHESQSRQWPAQRRAAA